LLLVFIKIPNYLTRLIIRSYIVSQTAFMKRCICVLYIAISKLFQRKIIQEEKSNDDICIAEDEVENMLLTV